MTVSLTRAALVASLLVATQAPADEGMWTYDNPPLALLKAKHGFEPTKEWLDKVRLASVRFMDGGSGSFVSPDGLMITNHHVGLGCIQNVSSAEHDFVKAGFHAATREKETACPGYEVNVLVSMEDVTEKVQGAVRAEMSDAAAREGRKAATAAIENECSARTKLRCNVVSLYQGGEYQLYRYRKYTDVRLVFAPEQSMAFFGGDPDNFTFPRHDLDICLMRAYEGGKPVAPASYLRWTAKGVGDGDLVFVWGTPARPRGSRRWPAWSTCATRPCRSAWRCSSAVWPPFTRTRASATSRSGERSTRSSATRTRTRRWEAITRRSSTRRRWR
jgi:hypothetical protein